MNDYFQPSLGIRVAAPKPPMQSWHLSVRRFPDGPCQAEAYHVLNGRTFPERWALAGGEMSVPSHLGGSQLLLGAAMQWYDMMEELYNGGIE